jgi:hypothetical protein
VVAPRWLDGVILGPSDQAKAQDFTTKSRRESWSHRRPGLIIGIGSLVWWRLQPPTLTVKVASRHDRRPTPRPG